ncbi:clavaminate synthase-like protein At3g21360 [Bidens hawaiensis]|uniref:clavaminate synthase-like protein At3g21360 n=1 Tax=Bidens hawaiensis TaxID=980011 RepID=UPI00404A094D
MATGRFFQEVELPKQKHYGNGVRFPAVLSPTTNTTFTEEANVLTFEKAINDEKPWLESLLQKSGVILFRGFPVTSPSEFNGVVEAFGYPEIVNTGGLAPRTKVIGRVYTANESPPEMKIPFHHEMSYLPNFPTKLFFFCEEEPRSGGETPIVLSHIVYEKMKEKHPEFVDKLEEHGLRFITVTGDEDHSSSIGGRGWKSVFMTDDKNVADERAKNLGTKLEWIENGVRIITGPVQAIRFNKETGKKTWFNNLATCNIGPTNGKIQDLDPYVELGNGDFVPKNVYKDLLKIMEEECVAIPWKKGDVMLVNNLTVLHGRQPVLKLPRRVLVSLCK